MPGGRCQAMARRKVAPLTPKAFDGGTTPGQDEFWRWDNDLVVAIFVPISFTISAVPTCPPVLCWAKPASGPIRAARKRMGALRRPPAKREGTCMRVHDGWASPPESLIVNQGPRSASRIGAWPARAPCTHGKLSDGFIRRREIERTCANSFWEEHGMQSLGCRRQDLLL
jgi:hypothetical protein